MSSSGRGTNTSTTRPWGATMPTANMKKELDDLVEDSKSSTWDEIKEKRADLPHHAKRRFKAVSLRTSGGHIRVADWREFHREYRQSRRYVED